jgi:predicted dinucleotide-binding enzyme
VDTRADTIEPGPSRFPRRPRVLIEHPDPDAGLALATALRSDGCNVTICRGPESAADPAAGIRPSRRGLAFEGVFCFIDTPCPVRQLERCMAVERADVVVTALGLEHQAAREVLAGLRTRYPNTPVVVEATLPDVLELERELRGCTVLPQDAEPKLVVEAVLAALPS